MNYLTPHQNDAEIAQQARTYLEQVVAVESSSDESSATIPSTPGQTELCDLLAAFFKQKGANIERDRYTNVIATLPARGASKDAPALAFMIHVDTARGTHPVPSLELCPAWSGDTIPYPANPELHVNIANYPALERYLGHDLLHGPGDAPFGLDDKLGLTHMMTLSWLLATNPSIPHPELLLIARPDEEIGRMEALIEIADRLAERGVNIGYTLDGLDPYEVNAENFNASQGSIRFAKRPIHKVNGRLMEVQIGGVNTHGATAKAEGHRPATRLAAEILADLESHGISVDQDVRPVYFASEPERDCDAVLLFDITTDAHEDALRTSLAKVVGPHIPRGASWSAAPAPADHPQPNTATLDALRFVHSFLNSNPGFVLPAEASEGYEGYSQPYRILPEDDDLRLDIRLRDFDPDALKAREQHVQTQAGDRPVQIVSQYVNMGPRIKEHPNLIAWPQTVGAHLEDGPALQPIRGGTGVDPFLERNIAIANLGTGYFAPESEKEFTSLQYMAGHAQWLLRLVQHIAQV